MIGEKEKSKGTSGNWNSYEADALRARILELCCKYNELMLVIQSSYHLQIAAANRTDRNDLVFKDSNTHLPVTP
jgi:hypothetical protein